MNRPGDATHLTNEERAAWIARVRATFAEKRGRGEIASPPSPEETLDELERDEHAGRILKFDLRISADEKARWYEAARAAGLPVSEFVRVVVGRACEMVLDAEVPPEPEQVGVAGLS